MDDLFADPNRREDQLYDELAASPVFELTGIVSPSGISAGKSRGQKLWSLLLSFDAWRLGSGPLRTDELTLRRRVNDKELRAFQQSIDPETVIQIRARVAEENVFGCPQGHLEELLKLDSTDSELHAYLAELQQPKNYQDDRFGTFTFDRSVSWYSAEVDWNGRPVTLDLKIEDPDDLDSALSTAYALWDQEALWNQRVGDYAVQELLPLKNDTWLQEDEAELSVDEFKNRMKLESISVSPEGEFEFWHKDGDLFWGHSIQISGSLSEGLTQADIPG